MATKMILLLFVLLLASCGAVVRHQATQQEARVEASHPPEGQFVDVDGVRVHAVVAGLGPDLVLIHGANGSTRDFTFALVDQLKDRYRVIALDRPGFGYTERLSQYGGAWTNKGESLEEQAGLMQAAAAQLGAESPHVVGYSLGGAVALAWAVHRPENISALTVLAGVSNTWPGDISLLNRVNSSRLGGALVAPTATAFIPDSFLSSSIESVFAPQKPVSGYDTHFGPRLATRRETIRANAQQVRRLKSDIEALVPQYKSIKVPTEILFGDADTVLPIEIHGLPLPDQIPGANLTVLEGVGHMLHQVRNDETLATIDRATARAGLR